MFIFKFLSDDLVPKCKYLMTHNESHSGEPYLSSYSTTTSSTYDPFRIESYRQARTEHFHEKGKLSKESCLSKPLHSLEKAILFDIERCGKSSSQHLTRKEMMALERDNWRFIR